MEEEAVTMDAEGPMAIVAEEERVFDEEDGLPWMDGGVWGEELVGVDKGGALHGRVSGRSLSVGKACEGGELEVGIEGGGRDAVEGGEVDGAVVTEVGFIDLDGGDPTDDELGLVEGDGEDFGEFEADAESGFGDEGSWEGRGEEGGEAGGLELGSFSGVACRALVGGEDDFGVEVIEGPVACFEDIGEGMAFDDIGSSDHGEERWVGAEVDDAGEGGEVGVTGAVAGADEGDGFSARERGGKLDADEFVHGGDLVGGDGSHGGVVVGVVRRRGGWMRGLHRDGGFGR